MVFLASNRAVTAPEMKNSSLPTVEEVLNCNEATLRMLKCDYKQDSSSGIGPLLLILGELSESLSKLKKKDLLSSCGNRDPPDKQPNKVKREALLDSLCGGIQNFSDNRRRADDGSEKNSEYEYCDLSSSMNSQEEEVLQMKRLGSWNTIETTRSEGTLLSVKQLDANGSFLSEGSMIGSTRQSTTNDSNSRSRNGDIKEGENTSGIKTNSRNPTTTMIKNGKQCLRRRRLVKFEYPLVSSLKQCPRADPDDIPQLFFTEEELDQFEADRVSTHIADDIEVVAVSTSISSESDRADSEPRAPHLDLTNSNFGFNKHVSSPRKCTKNSKEIFTHPSSPTQESQGQSDYQEDSETNHLGQALRSDGGGQADQKWRPRKRSSTPGPPKRASDCILPRCERQTMQQSKSNRSHNFDATASSSNASAATSNQDSPTVSMKHGDSPCTRQTGTTSRRPKKPDRLIKSVQIYLRERSTGR